MTEEIWRPLGFDAAEDPTFDVLRDDVPPWLEKSLRTWIMGRFVRQHMGRGVGGKYQYFLVELLRKAERQLRFSVDYDGGITAVDRWGNALFHNLHDPTTQWRLVDFLLAESGERTLAATLDVMLVEAGSAWKVGVRAGRLGLEKRVPEGVQVAAESTFAITGNAGRQLAEAWAAAFGVDPDPSKAYSRAVKAVEDAAIPVVSPLNGNATLGTVIRDIENQGDHKLPMTREHPNAIQGDVLVGMLRVLWVGQHDRHGNSALPPVSQEEAEAAVVLAVTLVDWFATGKIKRRKKI